MILLAIFGVLSMSSSTLKQDQGQVGGLYQFEAGRFTYPNGETWGPYKQNVFIPVTSTSETIIYCPGAKNPLVGKVSGGSLNAKGPVFGLDFTGAPRIVQILIEDRKLERNLTLSAVDGGKRLTGRMDLFWAKWKGDVLESVDFFQHPVTLTRVESQVKTFEMRFEGFDQVLSAREPERSKQLADAQKAKERATEAFNRSRISFSASLDPIGKALVSGSDARKSIPPAIADIENAGAGLRNAAHRKIVQQLDALTARQRQIQQRLETIRRDMPRTPASVTRNLERESSQRAVTGVPS